MLWVLQIRSQLLVSDMVLTPFRVEDIFFLLVDHDCGSIVSTILIDSF